jgi:Zn-finger nucleic acid-binding protein
VTIARAYRCPTCGGDVREGARACGYCRTPVATVRCARCFHMNVPEALHCSGCGSELGLCPVGKHADLCCPQCECAFDAFSADTGSLLDCPRCGGQFVNHSLLKELLERKEAYGLGPQRAPTVEASPERVQYRPCPVCRAMMNRKNFGRVSGVVVDVCREHGIWFDLGELPRVMAFVRDGGLLRTEIREAAEAADQASRARLATLPTMSSTTMAGHRHPEGPFHLDGAALIDDLARATSELLQFVSSIIRR